VGGPILRVCSKGGSHEVATLIRTEFDRIDEVRVNVLTDARVRDKEVEDITVQGRLVVTEVWDIERLYRASGEAVTRDRIEIDFTQLLGRPLSCLEMKPRPSEYETYLVILPGQLIYQLYDQYGPRLFEFNVRSFLQAKGFTGSISGVQQRTDRNCG
jgi:hypothetical protein